GLVERGGEPLALARTDDVHVVDVPGLVGRKLADVAEAELRVGLRCRAPAFVPLVEVAEEDAQRRGLQLVEARVVADDVKRLLVTGAVEAEETDAVGELGAGGRDEAAVA